jgi:exopolyphosphatase/guanosine-5'-triphosphate,3'-diphosphate pyrophosphatase
MPRFAAIDVGSNATRLLVVEAEGPDAITKVASQRAAVRMGHEVFLTGRLAPSRIDGAIEALVRFKAILDEQEVASLRAVVTASARDAVNADELLRRAEQEAGITLEAISGTEEARLVKLAVETKVTLGGYRSLLVDLGGGSLELSEVRHDEVRFNASLEIGTVRLLESFLDPSGPVTDKQERVLTEYVERHLDPVSGDYRRRQYDRVVGTGGNFDALARLCGVPNRELPTIDVPLARALLSRMRKLTPQERMAAYDLREDRADVLVPALYVILAVADLARTNEIVAPGVGLKNGMVVELVRKHFSTWDYGHDDATTARAAIQLGRRYHFDEPHATQVDRLACQLFDQLLPLHQLGADDRRLLRAAALTHDLGEFIASTSHHKHTFYVLANTDVLGLSQADRHIVANVARYHRRAMPSTKHLPFKRLANADRSRVRKLASILRVADALDRGHRSKVRSLTVTRKNGTVILEPHGRDLALEVWTARRKAELFEKTFEKSVEFVLDEER